MSTNDEWCLIESDPGVFTELLEKFGCPKLQVEELYSLDNIQQLLSETKQIYGFIFLFQWKDDNDKNNDTKKEETDNTSSSSKKKKTVVLDEKEIPEKMFFAHQVTTNACATQALLHVVLNSCYANNNYSYNYNNKDDDNTDDGGMNNIVGTTLRDFYNFTSDFSPHLKGVSISDCTDIRNSHNEFALSMQETFLHDVLGDAHLRDQSKGEAFHFIAYIPFGNKVYELDGLQKGPIEIGEFDNANNDDWLSVAQSAIQERMNSFSDGTVKFNLLAVIHDKRETLQDDHDVQLSMEIEKRERWKMENERRRHNYVPFCIQYFQELAAMKTKNEGQVLLLLPKLIEQAQNEKKQKKAAAATFQQKK